MQAAGEDDAAAAPALLVPGSPLGMLVHLPLYPALVLCHLVWANWSYRLSLGSQRESTYWLRSLVGALVTGHGGGTLINLLHGRPPGYLVDDSVIPAFLLMHWLVFYLPGDAVWRTLNSTRGRAVLWAGEAWITARFVADTQDWAIGVYHGAWVPTIAFGWIAGCGGSLLRAVDQRLLKLPGDQPFSPANSAFTTQVIACVLYPVLTRLLAVHPLSARVLLILLEVTHDTAEAFLGPLDMLAPLAPGARLFNVPDHAATLRMRRKYPSAVSPSTVLESGPKRD